MLPGTLRLLVLAVLMSLGIAGMQNSCYAQVGMKLELNQVRYLQFEPIYAKVTFVNRSGRPIAFSDSKNFRGMLKFVVTRVPGNAPVSRRSTEVIPVNGLIFQPGEVESMTYQLSRFYKIFDTGNYEVKAILSHDQLPAKYESNRVNFVVQRGVVIFEQLFGVPNPADPTKNINRKYIIQSAFNGKKKILYLLVEDEQMIYCVKPIGYDKGTRLKCRLDGMNQLHILLCADPRVYNYFKFNIYGEEISKDVYHKVRYVPQLVTDPKTGRVAVVGGKKAIKGLHYVEDDGTIFGAKR